MTLLSFFGNLFTAYGPALMVMLLYLGPSARLMMMSLSSGFIWLLSILIIAIIAHFLPDLSSNSPQMVVMSSVIQELGRVAIFYMFKFADPVLVSIASDPTTKFNRVHHAVAADVFFIGAITTSLFIFLHISWTVVAFDGWFKGNWFQFVWVLASHIGASMATLWIPSSTSGGCVYSILVSLAILASNGGYSFWVVQSKIKTKQS
ncbi:hypothetical protein BASA81_018078 [Batrachochytrium salamandrivorans]|nr:hypothetical protein BASA81_018078 [Batrachochytrium salamandrivorans]